MADIITMVRLYAHDTQELEVCGEIVREVRGTEEQVVPPLVLIGEEAVAACSGLKQRLLQEEDQVHSATRRVLRGLDYFYEEVA